MIVRPIPKTPREIRKDKNKVVWLALFVIPVLVLSSCHPRSVSDIKLNMTRDQVASLWGGTPLVSHRTANGKTTEIWEYHFLNSNSVCWVTFLEDKVATTECRPMGGGYYYPYYRYYPPYPYPYYPYYYPHRPY